MDTISDKWYKMLWFQEFYDLHIFSINQIWQILWASCFTFYLLFYIVNIFYCYFKYFILHIIYRKKYLRKNGNVYNFSSNKKKIGIRKQDVSLTAKVSPLFYPNLLKAFKFMIQCLIFYEYHTKKIFLYAVWSKHVPNVRT